MWHTHVCRWDRTYGIAQRQVQECCVCPTWGMRMHSLTAYVYMYMLCVSYLRYAHALLDCICVHVYAVCVLLEVCSCTFHARMCTCMCHVCHGHALAQMEMCTCIHRVCPLDVCSCTLSSAYVYMHIWGHIYIYIHVRESRSARAHESRFRLHPASEIYLKVGVKTCSLCLKVGVHACSLCACSDNNHVINTHRYRSKYRSYICIEIMHD